MAKDKRKAPGAESGRKPKLGELVSYYPTHEESDDLEPRVALIFGTSLSGLGVRPQDRLTNLIVFAPGGGMPVRHRYHVPFSEKGVTGAYNFDEHEDAEAAAETAQEHQLGAAAVDASQLAQLQAENAALKAQLAAAEAGGPQGAENRAPGRNAPPGK